MVVTSEALLLYTPKPRPAQIWGLAAGLDVSLACYRKD